MREFGVHSATTRAGYGTNPPVQEVERRAAEFFGTEDAFYFSSGYIANHIMVGALARNADAIVIDESAHYSGREAAQLAGLPVRTFRSRDPEDLARITREQRRVLVLADAVAPATGQLAPVVEYMKVLERQERAICSWTMPTGSEYWESQAVVCSMSSGFGRASTNSMKPAASAWLFAGLSPRRWAASAASFRARAHSSPRPGRDRTTSMERAPRPRRWRARRPRLSRW